MRKLCVFCGEKPVDKTKEHIIPQWLIRYTGDPKRITLLGKKGGNDIKFPWLNFVFPACEECNSSFGKIEARIKTILIKLDNEQHVVHNELNLFFDWLDKIRIGMWLGHALLQNKDFEPNFFINNRVASKDRLCLVYRLNDLEQGIGIIGSDTPVFENTPSCFSIIINNMVFLNYSKEFLLSKNLGFPYPDKYFYNADSQFIVNKIISGECKITFPIIEGKIIKPAMKFYQSIIRGPHCVKRPFAGYRSKFYKKNCLVFRNDLIQSKIYISDEHKDYHGFWEKKKKFTFKAGERFERELLMPAIVQMTLEHQNHSLKESIIRYKDMEPEEKVVFDKYYEELLAFNTKKINEISSVMQDIYRII